MASSGSTWSGEAHFGGLGCSLVVFAWLSREESRALPRCLREMPSWEKSKVSGRCSRVWHNSFACKFTTSNHLYVTSHTLNGKLCCPWGCTSVHSCFRSILPCLGPTTHQETRHLQRCKGTIEMWMSLLGMTPGDCPDLVTILVAGLLPTPEQVSH